MSVPSSSPWSPLAHRGFRLLWPGILLAYVGTWMQTVGAQWLLVNQPGGESLVALVQTAAMLPIMLMALPAGVLADVFDRRWLLITVQGYIFAVAGTLAVLTLAGLVTPVVMLIFTFLIGLGAALQLPTWQAVIPEVVPRSDLGAATRLEMVGVNFGRSAGPAIAGVVIAAVGVPFVFALNALSVIYLAVALLLWRRDVPDVSSIGRERFIPALRAGGRYVRHEPVVRRILLRTVMFIAPACVLWALLPVVARDRLGLSAGGYGALFAALGVGAIVAALVVGRIRDRTTTNRLLCGAALVYAFAVALLVLVPNFILALVVLVLAGSAWTSMISTLNAELQVFLPVWVRARGLAVYLVTFTGAQALASVVWGQVIGPAGVVTTFLIGAGLVAAGALAGIVVRVPETGHLDSATAVYWNEVRVAMDADATSGPILVSIDFTVAPEHQGAYLAAMQDLRRSRLRSGAVRWELFRDAEQPDRFTEVFKVASWEEHLRQHEGRLTREDQRVEEVALAFSDPPPVARHLLPPA